MNLTERRQLARDSGGVLIANSFDHPEGLLEFRCAARGSTCSQVVFEVTNYDFTPESIRRAMTVTYGFTVTDGGYLCPTHEGDPRV